MIHIRFATHEDEITLTEIHIAAWQQAYIGMMPQPFLDNIDQAHALVRLTPAISATPCRVLVIEDGNQVLGFGRFGPLR